VLRVVALGTRRGPAEEAQQLYDDLSERVPPASERAADPQVHSGGRPEGRERRRFDALRRSMDD
jgi:ribosome-associated heat shock protein Hsp15